MKLKFALIASFVAILSLAGCGGGTNHSNIVVASPANLTKIDTVAGTGADAVNGKTVTVNYTGWLYSDTAADHKGAQFDAGSFSFLLGSGRAIAGFDQGVLGMKVGGKRTVLVPASLGYGAAGSAAIPPNSGLVFDIELTKVE